REKATGAQSQSLLRLIADPVLPRVDAGPRRQRLAAQLAVGGPPLHLVGGHHVRVHEEVAGELSPWEADVQMRGPHVDAEVEPAQPAAEDSPQERLLARLTRGGRGRVA